MKDYTVLIVDDSVSILNTLKNFIENDLEIRIITAKNLKECAKVFLENKGKFDVVLADLGLPDAPNGEIIDFISKFSIPTVVLTGSDNIDIENRFRNKNIVDYIIKDGLSALNYASSIVKRIIHNKNIKVLVVDDSETFLEKTSDLLKRYNLIALTAKNGQEALDLISQNRDIKIVLTDYLMPVIDGLELTKMIRKNYSKDEISIIVTSNDSSKKIPAKFLKYGANDFLYKGFSSEEFFARINSNIEIIELFDEMKLKANKDYLTGLYNRRYLFEVGEKIYKEYKESKKDFSTCILDIDDFKKINDNYGHDIGDIAIKEVAYILKDNIKSNSIITRLGGEEFCIIFYDRTKNDVLSLLEHIRNIFENKILEINEHEIKYTVSIGCCFEYGKNLDYMIQNSDKSLYDAKNDGKNRIRYR